MRFPENPGALERWRDAGADVRGDRVHLPKGLARRLCATAPREYAQHARNPERSVTVGGKGLVLAPVYGPPFVRDIEQGRRYATIEDFRNFVKLAYMSKWLHHSGGTVCEPTDIAVNKRHLDMVLAHMTLSDKPFMGSVTAPERAADSVEMCRILFGAENVGPNCYMTSLININSPLTFDSVMMGALEVYARAGQATIVSPFSATDIDGWYGCESLPFGPSTSTALGPTFTFTPPAILIGALPTRDMVRSPLDHHTLQRTSPPILFSLHSLLVMIPRDVETMEIPRPPSTRGISSALA